VTGRIVRLQVNGKPAPQGSKTRNRAGAVYESSKAVGPWREAVRAETQRAVDVPFDGAVRVALTFVLPRPGGHFGTGRNAGVLRAGAPARPAGVPDLDKLVRAVLDGLTAGGALKNDAQVVELYAMKVYPGEVRGWQAGCRIAIVEEE
jgi:crossover junction endodeoxyribonuclease RusA